MRRLLWLCLIGTALVLSFNSARVEASARPAPLGEVAESSFNNSYFAPGVANAMPKGAQVMDQSAFAMGTMVWNVILPQSNGSVANPDLWTAAEIQTLQTKIAAAETYWEGLTSNLHPGARLSITVNYVNGGNPVSVGYDPSADQSENWINAVMASVGSYNSSNRFTNVRNFNQDQRIAAGTNWATTIFAVHNSDYHRTSYGYAYYGGPYMVVESDSAGWGLNNLNMVVSHEIGHIFFGNDEYYNSGATVADRGGYLNTQNLNAERDANGNRITPLQPDALMLNNGGYSSHIPYSPSASSRAQFGFRDTDSDTIPDILDTLPTLTGSNAGSDANTGLFIFSGLLDVTTLANQNSLNVNFSNSLSAMTINNITGAYYLLDNGSPTAFGAVDGAYGGYSESLGFSISDLMAGMHSIDVYGVNSVGNLSNALHFDFQVVPEPSTIMLLAIAMASLGICARRQRRHVAVDVNATRACRTDA